MQLALLGCYGPYPPAGGACSGYLVSEDGYNLLLDCGNGVMSRLLEHVSYLDLHAVVLSHLHADHISDIMIMRYGLEMAFNSGLRQAPLPLYAPGEPRSEFDRLPYKNAYNVKSVGNETVLEEGPFKITFLRGIHAVPSLAVRLETTSATLVYSGDTEYFSALADFAAEADIFLCEANYLESDLQKGLPNHLSAAGAAQIASAAGVRQLILTHLYPERDPGLSLAEAVKFYPSARLAAERQVIQL